MRLVSGGVRIGAAMFGFAFTRSSSVMNPPRPGMISIRQATRDEAPLLTNMINDAFFHYHEKYAKDLDTAERVTSDGKEVATIMETPCNAFLVAEQKDGNTKSVVGCVHVCWSGETHGTDGGVDAHFGMLSVVKECKGRGIGKLLVSAAEERCRKELNRKNIVVEISVASFFPELFGWYETQGYRKKKQIPFPMPELVREGCVFELQLMTKTIP